MAYLHCQGGANVRMYGKLCMTNRGGFTNKSYSYDPVGYNICMLSGRAYITQNKVRPWAASVLNNLVTIVAKFQHYFCSVVID